MEPMLVSLLVGLVAKLATTAGAVGLRALLAQDADVVASAIRATCTRFLEIEGAETALRGWISSDAFTEFCERIHDGDRNFGDDEIVASFVEEGDFYFPTEEERSKVAAEIVASFINDLLGAIYRSEHGIAALAQRQEVLHLETSSGLTGLSAGIADLKADLRSALAEVVAQSEAATPATLLDPVHQELSAKIDLARDLINKGQVRSGRAALRQIKDEAEGIPEDLEFRILTDLGACALAEEDLVEAASMLEQAHNLQPVNQKGISNAAVAAHLVGQPVRAIALARRAREIEPRDSQATGVLLEALWETGEHDQLEEFVTAEEWIASERNCALVLGEIRAQQSRFEEAVSLYRSLLEADPKDATIHLVLSKCLLREAQATLRNAVGYGGESLQESEEEATQAIELLRSTELQARLSEALVTRAGVRALVGSTAEALSDLDEVLKDTPEHPDANFTRGLLLLEEGQAAEARALLEKALNHRREDVLHPLAGACLASDDAAAAVGLLQGSFSLACPSWEDVYRAELLFRAEEAAGVEDSAGPLLESALSEHSDNPRLLALKASRCDHLDDREGTESALLQALEHSGELDRRENLTRLGLFYLRCERFGEAADRLAEVVGGSVSHPLAVQLLVCLVNSERLREALDWAREVRETRPQVPREALEAQAKILERVGDLEAAVRCYEDLCHHATATAVDQARLAAVQFRCSDREAALDTVRKVSASDLCEDPISILKLAQLKLLLGQDDFLDDAYLARRCGSDEPRVHVAYLGFFLDHYDSEAEPEAVGPGCAVRLRRGTEERWWHVLDEGEEPRSEYEQPPTQDPVERLLGKRVGDHVVLRDDLETLSYEIVAIQSKYTRAFQETSEEFSTRFPESRDLSRVTADDEGLARVFLNVDQRDEFGRALEGPYREGRLPFASFASHCGRSVVEAWRACTEDDSFRIRFGIGTDEDGNTGSNLLREADAVALDLLALLTVYELGLAPHLQKRFSRVVIPQSVVDDLQETYYKTVMGSAPAGYLGKDSAGQYRLTEMTEDDWAKQRELVRSILQFAESFERIASYPLLDVPDMEELGDALTWAGVGAVYAGDEQPESEPVLVCDDLALAGAARSIGVQAVNTQAVLEELRRSDTITSDAYSSWIERLVLLNYWFVQVQADDVVRRLEENGYLTTLGTRSMLSTLAGPDCSEDSAASVAAQVVVALATRAPQQQVGLILAAVIEVLQRGRASRAILLKFRAHIVVGLRLLPLARDEILETVDLHIQLSS